jgi:NADH-quinone oxidoreductase subunit A
MYQIQLAQIFLFTLMGIALPALGMIGLSWLLQVTFGYHRPNPEKLQPYECGMKPIQEAHLQFDIRYYLYALLFIVFDIEIIFLVPWAVSSNVLGSQLHARWLAPIEMTIFLLLLTVGLAYAWKKGALEWE